MLTHFKYFDLTSLLKDFDWLHICLGYCFYRNFVAFLLMFSEFYDAKLPFTQIVWQFVIIIDGGLTYYFSNRVDPSHLSLHTLEVKNSRFVWWKNDLYRIEIEVCIRVHFYCRFLDESCCQTMHYTLLSVSFFSVTEEIFSNNNSPVLFETIIASL